MNILRNEQAYSNGGGVFFLKIRRPGLIDGIFEKEDHAFGPLSRINHAIGQIPYAKLPLNHEQPTWLGCTIKVVFKNEDKSKLFH
ncbi:hypothetical protein MKZ08_12810 [Viridibacillus sp. FSL R5-0477]|uniref:Uncharacterized protein n=1 Tax=Viridibacillus arenosi FSL R5-213 TaxID=1227360 RepID=W4EJ31_9BACL|nr:hypothetical protein [Viridibacillus arenosi]ETT80618.1 hypothetical protein C176_21611 [Viridibacillus arenosi FSL R5-213]OMC87515.1 hypothetical protein BK137_20740 [Viridibacillus arenosi]